MFILLPSKSYAYSMSVRLVSFSASLCDLSLCVLALYQLISASF
nr:MAG TPA: hypothetical protein [Bacteriophage sp.]